MVAKLLEHILGHRFAALELSSYDGWGFESLLELWQVLQKLLSGNAAWLSFCAVLTIKGGKYSFVHPHLDGTFCCAQHAGSLIGADTLQIQSCIGLNVLSVKEPLTTFELLCPVGRAAVVALSRFIGACDIRTWFERPVDGLDVGAPNPGVLVFSRGGAHIGVRL